MQRPSYHPDPYVPVLDEKGQPTGWFTFGPKTAELWKKGRTDAA